MLQLFLSAMPQHAEAAAHGHGEVIDVMDFLLSMTLSSVQFWIVLCCCFVFTPLLWTKGYAITEWFNGRKRARQWNILIAALIVFCLVGCLSQPEQDQHYGGWFALPVAALAVSLVVLVVSMNRMAREGKQDTLPPNQRWQRSLLLLTKFMVSVWSFGWVLYFIAMGLVHRPHVGAELLIRSAVYAIDLFVMEYENLLLDAIASHDILKGLIVCTGFVATLCTTVLLLGLVMSRIIAHLHLRHLKIDERHNHLYIFFGINDASRLLAGDILKHDRAARIIYVENSLAAEEKEGADDGKTRVKSLFLIRRNKFREVEDDRRKALAIANGSVYTLDIGTGNVWNMLGLQTIGRMLSPEGSLGRLGADAQLHVFFLSEETEKNMMSAAVITRDTTLLEAAYSTTIYCHGHRNGINCVLEVESLEMHNSRLNVRVLDSSSLALAHLKSDVANHPISFVDVEPAGREHAGCVTSAFTSLIIGFGETGQEATRFLYEYGAFPSGDSSKVRSRRSPFHCRAVDRNMDQLKGSFRASSPGMSFDGEQQDVSIQFYQMDFMSEAFYQEVLTDDFLEQLNYVVISLGNDELNMSVALLVLKHVFQKRSSSRHFRIYVRVRDKQDHMMPVAQFYNKWLTCDDRHEVLKVFGYNTAIFTFGNVVNNQYAARARAYYDAYARIAEGESHATWSERRRSIIAKGAPVWTRLQEILKKESQDRSNALHALTKLRMMELAGDEADDYDALDEHLKDALALTEHLRWAASLELMGYVYGPEKDYKAKTHPCIRPWEELPQDVRKYDYLVVKTTMEMKKGK